MRKLYWQNLIVALAQPVNAGIAALVNFIPRLIAGLIVIIIGLIVAEILKGAVEGLLRLVQLEKVLKRYGVPEGRGGLSWSNVLAEITRWFVVILFLIPTVDIWGIPRVTEVLNEVLLYLPNVLVAAIIAVLGMVIANLAHDVVMTSVRGVSIQTASTAAMVTRWAIILFVALAVLTQLGIAADLVRILFTGIVAMIAIAGGIAFGLGGQGQAREVLDELKKKLQ